MNRTLPLARQAHPSAPVSFGFWNPLNSGPSPLQLAEEKRDALAREYDASRKESDRMFKEFGANTVTAPALVRTMRLQDELKYAQQEVAALKPKPKASPGQ